MLGKFYIENLKFDFEKYANPGLAFMRPGAAAIAEFDDLSVKEITFAISAPNGFAISEIVVLGK